MSFGSKHLAALAFCAFLLASCAAASGPQSPTGAEAEEEVSLLGVVSGKSITLGSPATHVLTTSAGIAFDLRSESVVLGEMIGDFVEISGMREPLGVIRVETAQRVEMGAPEVDFESAALGFSASVPQVWRSSETPFSVAFGTPGFPSVLTVSQLTDAANVPLGEGVTVGNEAGIKYPNPNGDEGYSVAIPSRELLVVFVPGGQARAESAAATRFLQTLSFFAPENTGEVPELLDISTLPECGGPLRLRCGAGERCELQSLEVNAKGVCVPADVPAAALPPLNVPEQADPVPVASAPSEADNAPPSPEAQASTPIQVPQIGEESDWRSYENRHFSYNFSVPKNWWWRHVGRQDGALSVVEASDQEVTAENVLIRLAVLSGKGENAEVVEDETITLTLPRNAQTHFALWGPVELASVLRGMRDRIAPF